MISCREDVKDGACITKIRFLYTYKYIVVYTSTVGALEYHQFKDPIVLPDFICMLPAAKAAAAADTKAGPAAGSPVFLLRRRHPR